MRILRYLAPLLFAAPLFGQFVPHAPAKAAYCLNPSGIWIPIFTGQTASALPNGAPAGDLYGLNGTTWYGIACDAQGHIGGSGSPGGMPGQIQWNDGDDFAGASQINVVSPDDTNAALCVGLTTDQCNALFNGAGNSLMVSNQWGGLGLYGSPNDGFENGPLLEPVYMEGSYLSPLAVSDGDTLFWISPLAYDGSAFQNPTSVMYKVDGTVSSGFVPASETHSGFTQHIFEPSWTDPGKIYNGIEIDITDTGASAESSAFHIDHNSTPIFSVSPAGVVGITAPIVTTQTTAPTVSSNAGSGSLTDGTDVAGIIATGTASTATTLTFNIGWSTWASCVVSASTSTALPYVSAISKSAVTFTYVTTGTPTLYYHCFGS